tara:strand:- start:46 stop:444 length:399 start_codon:yes stop_codon:yes gene_type:complete
VSTLGERIQAYIDKRAEIDEVEERLKELKAEHKLQEEGLLTDYETDGIQSMNVSGKNVHLYRDLYVKLVGDIDKAHEALRAAGEGDLLRYGVNSTTLRARVKELDASATGIPEGLQPFIETTEAYKIRIRRA